MRLAAVLLAGLLLALASACGGGGGDNNASASLVHRLLQAATNGNTSGQLESYPGKLPAGLPAAPPQYPGAKIIVSSRQPAPTNGAEPTPDASGNIAQPELYLIVLDTADARDKVFDFYQGALEQDPWTIASTVSTEEVDTLQFSNVKDGDITGVVTIARGGKDNRTSVLVSLQDAGAFRLQLPPYTPPAHLSLPKQFPSDVPLYKGAIITSTAFVRAPDSDSFLVVFLTKDAKDTVVAFYRTAFQQLGWSVQAGAPLGVEERFNFQDSAGNVQGDLLADAFARDTTYTEVRIQIRQNPNRTPVATTPQPTAVATTPQATAGATPATAKAP